MFVFFAFFWSYIIKVTKNACGNYIVWDARALMLKGFEELAEAVKTTMAPRYFSDPAAAHCTSDQFDFIFV